MGVVRGRDSLEAKEDLPRNLSKKAGWERMEAGNRLVSPRAKERRAPERRHSAASGDG